MGTTKTIVYVFVADSFHFVSFEAVVFVANSTWNLPRPLKRETQQGKVYRGSMKKKQRRNNEREHNKIKNETKPNE